MYTITRKLAVVCLAVVFSVLMYGCGGGGSEQASTDTPPTDTPPTDSTDIVVTPTVDMSMVTAGLIVPAGTFTILPGESRDQYDATFTCPAEGPSCEVTVADDRTATSAGGLATAMNSVPGNAKLAVSSAVDTGMVTTGLTIAPGTYPIPPGGNMDAGDATITCSEGGVPCEVTVELEADGTTTATSAGGMATAMNSDAGNDRLAMPSSFTNTVTVGLTIVPGTYPIDPGGDMVVGDVTFTCDPGGVPCMVTVELEADGTTTATSAGGMATAMNSAAGNARLAESNDVDTTNLVMTLGLIIQPGTHPMDPGGVMDLYDATFTCPAGGLPCVVTVVLDRDGNTIVTSAGAMATVMISAAGTLRLAKPNDVDTKMMKEDGLIIRPGTYPILPGGDMVAGDATFSCPAGGVRCEVTVEADSNTATSAGGMATAMNSAAGYKKLNKVQTVSIANLSTGYETIPAGPYLIPRTMEGLTVGGATFKCPAGGVRCVVTVAVADDGMLSITSLGGAATAEDSEAVMETRRAIALSAPTTDNGALSSLTATGQPDDIDVTRSTSGAGGKTTIELTHTGEDEDAVQYAPVPVDRNNGWMGQRLTRAGGTEEMPTTQEATFYTNIEPADAKYWTLTGVDDVPNPATVGDLVFVIYPADQELTFEEDDTFTGAYIRQDGNGTRIPGTFTCGAEECTNPKETETEISLETGNTLLKTHLVTGWTFVSTSKNEPEGEVPDTDYMYFGHWLQSTDVPSDATTDYRFAVFAFGSEEFDVDSLLIDINEAKVAKYTGGAAGRYVTRKLRVINEIVDPKSPGSHGSFTAKANLTANFGMHSDFEVDDQNQLSGKITEFKDDGGTDLGFISEITLNRQPLNTGTIDRVDNSAMAEFDVTDNSDGGTGMGGWSAQFHGPSPDNNDEEEVRNSTLPTGVTGMFDVGTPGGYTKVTGAFAAAEDK